MGLRQKAKWATRRALKLGGWEIRRQPTLIDFLKSRNVDLVLDVGANVGQFGAELRQWGYKGGIVSFEPGANAFSILSSRTCSDRNWDAINCAMGSATGEATIGITRSTVFSSIREQAIDAQAYGSDSEIIGHETVLVDTVDRVLCSRSEKRVFVKIDTQGFEAEVVAGMSDLGRIVGVQMELPVVQLYRNNWTLAEALTKMQERGFEIAQVAAVNHLKADPVSLTEIDCVFRKAR